MSDDAQRWKEKYLKSIEQQEKLERRWDARLDLLRRGLVRSTLAAEGTDRAVDQCMKEMREAVRTDDMDAALAALLPRLEKAVLDSEQRRETRVDQISTALTALVAQLQTLPLPREVSRPLKNFAKQLDSRASQARELPLLLSELSGLQGKALSQLDAPQEPDRPGLLQRLFGAREDSGEASAPASGAEVRIEVGQPAVAKAVDVPVHEAPGPTRLAEKVEAQSLAAPSAGLITQATKPEPQPSDLSPEPAILAPREAIEAVPEPETLETQPQAPSAELQTDPVIAAPQAEPPLEALVEAGPEPETIAVVDPDALVSIDTPPQPPAMAEAQVVFDPQHPEQDVLYALPDSPEPSYSSVAKHIESTLLGLLDDLSLPEHHRPQAQAMRERLAHGLNWYELLPILDDLAVLMLAITDSGQHEFEAYLKRLNERLELFQSHLQVASEGYADSHSAARELDSQIREQVDGLQSSVQEAADLDSLKHVLESHLEGLLGTMDQHQQQRDQREQEVAARMQGLAERVASMEQEAQSFREHLEEQRQKALADPLTGLPNRAAWSERLEHEMQQWQQRGNNLSLAMLDLDHFKRINDNYGHLAGDKVLKIIASVLRKRLRPMDFIARFGGEEFVLLMPDTPLTGALVLGEKLRSAIEACPFHFKGERVTVTVSIGVSSFLPGERSEQVLKRADQALYRAKAAGRNRVELI